MAVAFNTVVKNNTGSSSQASVSVTLPAGVTTGQLGILDVSAERGLVPSLPTGWTQLTAAADGIEFAHLIAYRNLLTSDASTVVSSTVTTNRRMSATISIWDGCDLTIVPQIIIGTPGATGSSNTDYTHPSITPAEDDMMLLAISTTLKQISPFTHILSTPGGWTEAAQEVTTSGSSANPVSYQAYQLVSGGSGVPQSGPTVTANTTNYRAWASTLALAPLTIPPATNLSWGYTVTIG